jgi:hypothetical protein
MLGMKMMPLLFLVVCRENYIVRMYVIVYLLSWVHVILNFPFSLVTHFIKME